jgi:hypothetical protein
MFRRIALALVGVPITSGLLAACFTSSSTSTPPSCTDTLSSSVVPCRDASVVLEDGAATTIDAGISDATTTADATVDAGRAPGDAGGGGTDPAEAGPLPTCTGTFGIDPTFGASGIVIDPAESAGISTITVQPDGKYVVGGESVLARYGADGGLDTTSDRAATSRSASKRTRRR